MHVLRRHGLDRCLSRRARHSPFQDVSVFGEERITGRPFLVCLPLPRSLARFRLTDYFFFGDFQATLDK